MINFELLKEIIQNHNSFILTTHTNVDADAIGSEIAFYNILKKLGKNVKIINCDKTPHYLQFLDPKNSIELFDPNKHSELFNKFDVLVALDFNHSNRMMDLEKYFLESSKLKICIDHHQDSQSFVDDYFVDIEYSSTGHIIYSFIKQTFIIPFDLEIAIPLYAAIMTDTGSFRHDRTTPEVHLIAAHLLELGVDPTKVYDEIYEQGKFEKFKLLGEALQSLQLYSDNKNLAVMILKKESLKKYNAEESDTDGFVNFCMSIKDVKIGLKFLELEDGFKVSLRSKGDIPVHKLASEFGGGGHKNAAGIRIYNSTIDEMKTKIIDRALFYIYQFNGKKNV